MSTTIDQTYLMGRTDAETTRLIRQARILSPATSHLLREAGVTAGMRVLDLGSGAGDVALMAAELVGPTGQVIGVDRDPAVLTVARARAKAAGLANVTFLEGDLRTVDPEGEYDAVVGRLVLMYVPEPAAALRRVAGLVRPGGPVALQELNFTPASLQWYPAMALWQRFWEWM
jgi:ubiquinone/menaquinone biosynthesis C-methylase UbiE